MLRLRAPASTVCFHYDEVTAQASSLVDDRDRHSRDPFHLLFRANIRITARCAPIDSLGFTIAMFSILEAQQMARLFNLAQALGMSDFVQNLAPGVQDPGTRYMSSSY